ncbi:MAG: dihydroxy-acid dehydratase [Leptospiraceae bacterium]|nr:dihydroxy-acid dehydratase [Leptospiraceae bacterium]
MSSELTGIYRNLTSYGDPGFSRFIRRAFLASAGYDQEDYDRPIIGIADTTSDYTTCHRQMPEVIDAVKRGVLEAGGLPFVFSTISLGEILISPTSMLYRNLMAMETEEMIRAYPMDGVILAGGCDKTVPAQLMAGISANRPMLSVVIGPMMTGDVRGQRVGACTDCRRFWAGYRAGEIDPETLQAAEQSLCSTGGTCMVMGSASTMACLTEALGLMLPGGAACPSGSGDRLRHSVASGRAIVSMARSEILPRDVLSRASFMNALRVLQSISGSTNAVVHLMAIARRAGIEITLADLDAAGRDIPLLVNCKPAGANYLEDFHKAGGMPVLLKALAEKLDLNARVATGETLGDLIAGFKPPGDWQQTIASSAKPYGGTGSLVALKGSLAPDGAVLKRAAASAHLLKHTGPAMVFESPEDAAHRIDDEALGLTAEHVLILRNAGPVGAGMPEAGSLPIPRYLARQGVKDMVRVSDARMSGTAYGTVVLHCAPEAAAGGPLALVRNGDLIALDAEQRSIDLLVDAAELQERREQWRPPEAPERGYARLYAQHVMQADTGADFDFL